MELILEHLFTFLTGIVTGGAGGALITLTLIKKTYKLKGEGTITDQSGAKAEGDIVGRDKSNL